MKCHYFLFCLVGATSPETSGPCVLRLTSRGDFYVSLLIFANCRPLKNTQNSVNQVVLGRENISFPVSQNAFGSVTLGSWPTPPGLGGRPQLWPLASLTSLCLPVPPTEHLNPLQRPFPLQAPFQGVTPSSGHSSDLLKTPPTCPNPCISGPGVRDGPQGLSGAQACVDRALVRIKACRSLFGLLTLGPPTAYPENQARETQGTGSPRRLEQLPNRRGRQPGAPPSALALHHLGAQAPPSSDAPGTLPFGALPACLPVCSHMCMHVHICVFILCVHMHPAPRRACMCPQVWNVHVCACMCTHTCVLGGSPSSGGEEL